MTSQAPCSQPPVALCIPAHGSVPALLRLLASVQAVDYPAGLLQVVVSVDGPDDALTAAAQAAGATVVVLPDNRGSYAARNAAIDAVRGDAEVVLFTDVDCVVAPDWVRAHLAGLVEFDATGGAVRLTTSTPPRAAEWVDASRHLRQRHFVENLGFAATCNLGVRREVLEKVRFDPTLRSGGDFDFGQRLTAAGYSLGYLESAVVEHPARSSSAAVLRKVSRVAKGAAVNQSRGHDAAVRRDPARVPALRRAQESGLPAGPLWRAQVGALDIACSLVYARHVPAVVTPALRRRLRGTR